MSGPNAIPPPIQALLQRFDATPDLLTLRQAGEQLDGLDLFAPSTAEARGQARLGALQAWLQVLKRLDAARVTAYQPDDPPAMRLAVPAEPGQPFYPPGIEPARVADPAQRAAYERDLAANGRKRQLAARHWEWQALDMELNDRARRFIQRFYTASNADQGELAEAMTAAAIGAARRGRLRSSPAKP